MNCEKCCDLSFLFNPAIKYICSWILYGLRNITLTINECKMDRERKNAIKWQRWQPAMELEKWKKKNGERKRFGVSFIHFYCLFSLSANCANTMEWIMNDDERWTNEVILCLCPTLAVIIIALGFVSFFWIVFSFSFHPRKIDSIEKVVNGSGSSIPLFRIRSMLTCAKLWIINDEFRIEKTRDSCIPAHIPYVCHW